MLMKNRWINGFNFPLAFVLSGLIYSQGASSDVITSPVHAWIDEKASIGFSGMVLLARGGDILIERGFGLADKEAGNSYTAETVVDVMSVTKQFTAAAVLKLQERGLLSVNDKVDLFFEDVPEDKKSITLHHLLTHTSGLKNSFHDDYKKVTRDDLERSIWRSKLLAVPGEKYSYSNVGYGLLGIVIEKVSGESYEEFLSEQLFKPAGMKWTGYNQPDWELKNVAVGYRSSITGFHGWVDRISSWFGASDRWGTPIEQHWAEDGPWWSLRANGGILSTLNDLHRWHLALENDLVLSTVSKDQLYFPHFKNKPDGNSYYAYGWVVTKENEKTTQIYHDGGNPYFFSLFYHSVAHDFLLLYATNNWKTVRSGEINRLIEAAINVYSKTKQ